MRHTITMLVMLATTANVNAEWFHDVEAGLTYDDNINRAEAKNDIETDTLLSLGLIAGRAIPLETGQTFVLLGNLKFVGHTEFADLSSARPSLTARYLHKFGLGPFAPRVSLGGTVEHLAFRDELRDGWRYRAALGYNKRLDEQWDINGNVTYSVRRMQDVPGGRPFPTDVFDQDNLSLSLNAGYAASADWLLNIGYRYDNGDVDSVATIPNPRFVQASSARIFDPVFGANKVVYKLDAETHSFMIDASWALNELASVNFGYERIMTDAVDNIEYDSNIFRINILRTF